MEVALSIVAAMVGDGSDIGVVVETAVGVGVDVGDEVMLLCCTTVGVGSGTT